MIKKIVCKKCGKQLENSGIYVEGEDGFYCDTCDIDYDEEGEEFEYD